MKWIILTEIICVVLFPSNAFAQRFSMDPITVSNETSTVITLSAADAIDITQYLMNSNARISIQMDNACQTALVQYENQLLHVRDIHIKDHLAYIADSINGLLIVDIESPHMPKQLSQCKIPGTANLITINASTAFITDQDKGIYMIDISDPSFPQFMHTVKTSGTVLDIIAYHQLLMIADSKEGLRIYDLTSTESPEIMATFQQSAAITAMSMDQDTLYCVDYFSGIYSVDIQFDEPLVLNKILDISNIETLFVSQGYIFIATRYQGISIIDRQTLETLWSIKTPGNIHQIYSTEHIIYALDGIAGLQVILFNSVQSPQIIASVNTKDRATKCALYDQFAYIADRSGAFNIVDLHHMYSKKSIYSIPSTDIIYDIVYFENQLFVADGKAGIKIFSPLSDPQWMNKMIHIDTPGTANGIYVDSNFIMVADGDQGVQIIQKNGTHYDFSGTIDTTGYAKDIVRYSSYAFVANMTDQVKVIHMAYPSNPSIVSSIPCKGMSMHLCLSQHTLVVSEGDMGIEIFDIENPSHAKCLQWINTPGFAFQTALIDNSLIVADGSAGIHIYQKQDQIFTRIESIESHDTAQKIVVDDHDIYVIDSGGRIMVFELCPDDSIQLKNHISVRATVHHIVKHDDLLFLADAYGLSALPMPYEIQGISIQDKSHASFQLPKIKYHGIYSVNIIKHGNVMPVDGYIQFNPQLDKPSPGLAIIVGGGEFSRNNRFAETTLKLTTQMYQDLITLGFDDDSIHWMINSNMVDIDYDGQCDKVVDHTYPTVQEFLNVLDHAKMNALDRNNPLFIYLQGAATQKGLFDIQDKQDHLKPDDLNCKLDKIQAQTDCLIIMLMEFSYAGAFIETLSKHDRIIITSVDADSYDLIDNINDAFSRILLANIVNNGESLTKAFIRAKNDKINHLWPGCPLMDDNGDGIANAFDGFFADQVFNLVVETHDLSMMEIIVMGLQSLCGLERDRLRAVGLEGVIGLMRILSGKL